MSMTRETLASYVKATSGIELRDESVARLLTASTTATESLGSLAATSLFETEPEQLHTVLDAIASENAP